MSQLVDMYHNEQQAVMMTSVNLCAHIIEAQKADTAFWETQLTRTGS